MTIAQQLDDTITCASLLAETGLLALSSARIFSFMMLDSQRVEPRSMPPCLTVVYVVI